VKKVLMDQRALAGVGNIYAQEALFEAGIDPSKPARSVPAGRVAPLHAALVAILRASIARQGTTVRDYRTGTGESGSFQFELKVYDREGEPCVRCGTALTGTHAIDARITVFCHRCQS
jgi:formamidopyrimidine-DNA glycosylase